jgi:hypothetical protein
MLYIGPKNILKIVGQKFGNTKNSLIFASVLQLRISQSTNYSDMC